jgi:hypothetical protein
MAALEEMRSKTEREIDVRWWGDRDTYKGMTFLEEMHFSEMEHKRSCGNSGAVIELSRYPEKLIILAPKIRTSNNLAVFLHELGHIEQDDVGLHSKYHEHMIAMQATWSKQPSAYIVQAERAASQFAIDHMREQGVLTKCAVKLLNEALDGYDLGRRLVPILEA